MFGLKQFRPFLLGPEFLLRTDHAALTSLLKTPEPVGQQARWLDLLAEYQFKIQHRAGAAAQQCRQLEPAAVRSIGAAGAMQAVSEGGTSFVLPH